VTVAFSEAVTAWAPAGWRELPWRRTRDPWAVLVSEVMLQQTQATRVIPGWTAFMRRWPTARECATASPGDVVTQWAGLGYNRRALNIHKTARRVTEDHQGSVPDNLDALLALPGVGPYTARAVLAFAFERDIAALDVNNSRVVARAVVGKKAPPAELQQTADGLVPPGGGWAWNQAVMDLGATICTARLPRCTDCPVQLACAWQRTGGPDPAGRGARQSKFQGSDRQGRGKLITALRHSAVTFPKDIAAACGWPADAPRALRIANRLIEEGFAVITNGELALRPS
jgi:A/G-specific adenine glycosylase